MSSLILPNYQQQSPEVAARFERLKSRPVSLKVENLGKTFHSHQGEVVALKDISFKVHHREFLSVIGPSGCGKSTLIRILAGLETLSSGEVKVDGNPVRGPGPDRGMVFQGYTLFPWLTVKANVMFGLEMTGSAKIYAEQEARQWIQLVGLEKFENAYPHQLSGGMKQRVAIARALANRPKILLMDEPFGALDAQTRAHMQSYLLKIWEAVDVTILFITHDLDEAVYLSDRILVLKAHPGEVQEMIEVPVAHPRNRDQFVQPEFLATRKHIEDMIHPPGDAPELEFKMPRMTDVDNTIH